MQGICVTCAEPSCNDTFHTMCGFKNQYTVNGNGMICNKHNT